MNIVEPIRSKEDLKKIEKTLKKQSLRDLLIFIIANLNSPKLAIYSGSDNWGIKAHHPSILLSHGITWDTPEENALDVVKVFSKKEWTEKWEAILKRIL